MSAVPVNDPSTDDHSLADRFLVLFAGLDRAHGRYEVPRYANPDAEGKIKGRAWTVHAPLTNADFVSHLSGNCGIGVCPIREDATCVFGAIDVDVYTLDLVALAANVKAMGLPLHVCRTKSGGAHLYLFLSEAANASLVRAKLKAWASSLGHPGVEIFPKQETLTSADEMGNWINLPYFAGARSTRYALQPDGSAMTPLEFLTATEAMKITSGQLSDWLLKMPDDAGGLLTGAPPCLPALASRHGFDGWENNSLFNIAVYLKKRYPDGWQGKVDEYNTRFLTTPVPAKDVKTIVKSVGKKDYFYKCKDQPIVAVCDKGACRGCQFGIGPASDVYPIGKIDELNNSHAAVWVGDKVIILKESVGPDGRPSVEFASIEAFKAWYGNQTVMIGEQGKRLGHYWFDHPKRRQYEGLTFAPGRETPRYYNTWRGFSCKPEQGDWSQLRNHLLENVCQGNEELLQWVIGWFAAIIQRPENKMGTALAIRGKQGTGKTTVGREFGGVLGAHYKLVSDPRYITGRFNSHMSSLLLLHADEAFWAGDHAAEGKLKDLITGDTHMVEYKGKEPVEMPNHVRLLVTGNQDWVVPAAFEERRFAVLEIGEAHIKDLRYFADIDDQMKGGGRAALLYDLMHFDLDRVNLRQIPQSAALAEQKRSSFTAEQRWWADVLERGRLPWGTKCASTCSKEMLSDDYIEHARKHGARARSIQTQLGMFLKKMVPGLRSTKGEYRNWHGRKTYGGVYEFPALTGCRSSFDKKMGQETEWSEPTEWLDEPEPPTQDGREW